MTSTRRSTIPLQVMAGALLTCWTGVAVAGSEGTSSTYYGHLAGSSQPVTSAGVNSLFGVAAGRDITTGTGNTVVGAVAGLALTGGSSNTMVGSYAGAGTLGARNVMVGASAGEFAPGSGNVFIGYRAGFEATGSNKLFIDNCVIGDESACDVPLVYGEFDNRLLAVDGVMRVTANRTLAAVKSQLHFSVTGADEGGWLTSASANNFFTSSGARYDANAGGWIQRSADGKAVISGSGAAGFRVLTSSGGAVGGVIVPVSRLHIDFDGLMGVNIAPAAGRAINTSTGAYLSSGGVWTNASSRELKEDIERLSAEDAQQAFARLEPVRFRYKDENATHVGFIAEDVPELVATPDRKGLSPMDVVAVLTKVVQEKSRAIERQEDEIAAQSAQIAALRAQLQELAAEVRRKR